MTKDEFIHKVKSLNFPTNQYIIFGSGPLVIHGIRETRDVDIVVLPELYKRLKDDGWEEKEWQLAPLGNYLFKDNVEVGDNWNYGEYNPDPQELINRAEIIEQIPFAPLEDVLKWKKTFNRIKDQQDIILIENFLHQ